MRRWRLRARFLLVLIILLVVTFSAITLVIVRENTHTLRTNLVNQSISFASLATQPIGSSYVLYSQSGTIKIKQEIDSFTSLDNAINQVEIIDTNGKVLFADDNGPQIAVSQSAASSINLSYMRDKRGNLTAIVEPYVESFGLHRYAVVYGISYDSVNSNIRAIVTSIITLSVVILLASMVLWYVFINRLFLRPVARISQEALLISKGELNRKIQLGRNDEIGDLATAVDTMASSLKADIDKLKALDKLKSEFLMITSHNLRTPLTVIQGYVDIMKNMDVPEAIRGMIQPISSNVLRLQGFAEDVLTISTIENGDDALRGEPQDMGKILARVAQEFADVAKQKQLVFEASVETDAWVNLDKSHFHSAMWNLLDNAYKFTKNGGTIELKAVTTPGKLDITVRDTGIGIASSEMPQLFTKFHRGTSTLTYDYEGTGIGLYITKLIMKQHGGDVTVQSIEGQGSSFTLSLPTIPAPAGKPAGPAPQASSAQPPVQPAQESPAPAAEDHTEPEKTR
ncbi:MAG: ATP-binding protein [Candidatus Saccharibacteria bacterium]